jgi:hypothetical protein
MGSPNLQCVAGGTIRPSRVVKISTAADNTVLESASATSANIGIAQESTRRAPGTGDDDSNAALVNENIMVYSVGSGLAPGRLGGTVTRGDVVTSDGSGLLITTTTDADVMVGWAFQSGVTGDIVAILVQPGFRTQ